VSSSVAGASVRVDGVHQCDAPCEIKVPVGDAKSHEIRLVKEGYVDVVVNWAPQSVSESFPQMPDMRRL
jgi:hypothetical protein